MIVVESSSALATSALATDIVAAVLGRLPVPPVDLSAVAQKICVSALWQTQHACFADGFTDFREGRPVIYIDQNTSQNEERFVLAHELAHVMLRTPEAKDAMARFGRTNFSSEEEQLADSVAASLLLPDSFVNQIRGVKLTLGYLSRVADLVAVSLTVLTTRLAAAGFDIALLHWQQAQRMWHVVDRPGAPPTLHGRVKLSERATRVIDNLSYKESEVVIDGYVGGRYIKISGTAYRDAAHAFHFIRPSRDIWPAVLPVAPLPPLPSPRIHRRPE